MCLVIRDTYCSDKLCMRLVTVGILIDKSLSIPLQLIIIKPLASQPIHGPLTHPCRSSKQIGSNIGSPPYFFYSSFIAVDLVCDQSAFQRKLNILHYFRAYCIV